jgi:ankyrin repeat protein
MAAVEDAKALLERVYNLAEEGRLVELKVLLEEHPGVDVDGYKDWLFGRRALSSACRNGYTECARLLIDHKADVHAKGDLGEAALNGTASKGHLSCVKLLVQNGADVNSQDDAGRTPLINSAFYGHLTVAQHLLEQKADIHYRISKEGDGKNMDALNCAMGKFATDSTPGIAFAFLSCNTDAKNVKIKPTSTSISASSSPCSRNTCQWTPALACARWASITNLRSGC